MPFAINERYRGRQSSEADRHEHAPAPASSAFTIFHADIWLIRRFSEIDSRLYRLFCVFGVSLAAILLRSADYLMMADAFMPAMRESRSPDAARRYEKPFCRFRRHRTLLHLLMHAGGRTPLMPIISLYKVVMLNAIRLSFADN